MGASTRRKSVDGAARPAVVAVQASAHVHDDEVVVPMRTGLRDYEVPHGLRLAGVTTAYREGGTYTDCLATLFTWHNQTLNSWTMIFGWLLSSYLLYWTLVHLRPRGLELVAFLALWLCPTLHLPFTVGYHQFLCMSPAILRRWRALDIAFIFIASIPLTFAMGAFVMPLPATLALTAGTVALSLHAWHNASLLPAGADIDKKANTRYVGMVVMVYTFPIMLQAASDCVAAVLGPAAGGHLPYADPLYTLRLAAAVIFCFVHGGVTYVLSFPDVWTPGVFDVVGAGRRAADDAHGHRGRPRARVVVRHPHVPAPPPAADGRVPHANIVCSTIGSRGARGVALAHEQVCRAGAGLVEGGGRRATECALPIGIWQWRASIQAQAFALTEQTGPAIPLVGQVRTCASGRQA